MNSDTFTVGGRRGGSKNKDLYLKGYGKAWGEKLTFTCGISYFFGGTIGLLKGIYNSRHISTDTRMTQHLYKYNVWNTIGRSTIRSANSTAGAALMFCLIGKVADLVFEEEI